MHKILRPIGKLSLIDCAVALGEKTRTCTHHRVFEDDLIQLVDVDLCVLAHVHIAKSSRRSSLREERVEYDRILTVVVEAALSVLRVILRGVQHLPVAELAEVQHGLAVAVVELVVPIDHHGLIGRIDGIVIDILGQLHRRVRAGVGQAGILFLDALRVNQLNVIKVCGLLNIRDARLPEEVEHVQLTDVDVTEAIVLGLIPEYACHARAGLELVPPHVAVGQLKVVLFKDHRQDTG